MEMDRPDMQTPDDAAARYSFLFPIGESRRFKPSHPTIGDMCVNATLPLASRARRPRDLLPHSAPSGRCCSPICCPPLLSTQPQARPRDPGIQGSFSAESAPTQPALSCLFHQSDLQPPPRDSPLAGRPHARCSTWRLRLCKCRLVPLPFLFSSRVPCPQRDGSLRFHSGRLPPTQTPHTEPVSSFYTVHSTQVTKSSTLRLV